MTQPAIQPVDPALLTTLIDIARAAEGRNAHTADHSERVAVVAVGIAELLGLPGEQLERIRLMARLHNLGVTGTRDSVLLKTGKLTPLEFNHIQHHTVLGAQLLANIRGLEDVAEVCLTHHERWDGCGYPSGIAGQEIPRFARLIAVADTFCAIISGRPHRDSLPVPVAADIIAESRDTVLCPEFVDGFQLWYDQTGGRIDLPS